MILLLVLYLIVMMGIAIYDLSRIKNFEDYAVAGKKQRTYAVVMTMLATIIGASSTVGLIDTTYNIGFPAIWWLLFGALGLLLQSIFISKKIRNLNADTLPQAAGIMVAPIAERVIAAVIVISCWATCGAEQHSVVHSWQCKQMDFHRRGYYSYSLHHTWRTTLGSSHRQTSVHNYIERLGHLLCVSILFRWARQPNTVAKRGIYQ